ncbi:unnamed protein product [Clonostachys rosea]|uniref:Uncharacterized protein n=1 Tax=Bionectria ochroleuca TaxID=29856 RepID=A0ABY6UTS4_BIOOC|nr:unnamed protein product [Clonostachys rosea]
MTEVMNVIPGNADRDILFRLLHDNEFSATEAVKEITERTNAAAISPEDGAVSRHAQDIAYYIFTFARKVCHNEQSQLLELLLLLRQQVVPDPNQGGILALEPASEEFWSDVPWVRVITRSFYFQYVIYGPPKTPGEDRIYENIVALLAQMSEHDFCTTGDGMSWAWRSLTSIIHPDAAPIVRNVQVRSVCMWMIYAPNKVRMNALLLNEGFEVGYWERWKALLQDYQKVFLDQDTQQLINTALSNMELVERVYPELI